MRDAFNCQLLSQNISGSMEGLWSWSTMCCRLLSQVLEDELTLRKKEQEIFFRMSEDSECLNVGSPNKLTKFLPYVDSSTTWAPHTLSHPDPQQVFELFYLCRRRNLINAQDVESHDAEEAKEPFKLILTTLTHSWFKDCHLKWHSFNCRFIASYPLNIDSCKCFDAFI